jgi:hypothetical protein
MTMVTYLVWLKKLKITSIRLLHLVQISVFKILGGASFWTVAKLNCQKPLLLLLQGKGMGDRLFMVVTVFCSVIDVFHHLQHLFELYHYHQTSKVIHVRTFITNWPLKPPDRSRCLYILTLEAGVGTWCHVISVRLEVRRSTTINSRSPMPLPCSNNNNGFWQFSFATVQNDAPPRILKTAEQSYKGKVKTHNDINRQNQSTTGKLWKP